MQIIRKIVNTNAPLVQRVARRIFSKLYRAVTNDYYSLKIDKNIEFPLWLDWRDSTDAVYIFNKVWEEGNTNFIIKNLNGGVLVDAGANVGYFSQLAKTLGGKSYPIEPLGRNKYAIEKVGLTPLPYALGKEDGTITLRYRVMCSGSPSTVGYFGVGKPVIDAYMGEETVEMRSLKSVVDEIGVDRIRILKMDIQGAEYEVLKAFEDSLGMVDYYIIEYSPTSYGDDLVGFMRENDFHAFDVNKDGSLSHVSKFINKKDYVYTRIRQT